MPTVLVDLPVTRRSFHRGVAALAFALAALAALPAVAREGVDVGGNTHFDPTLDELALLAASAGDEPVARIVAVIIIIATGLALAARDGRPLRLSRVRAPRRSAPPPGGG